ncbi:hypothetical protein C5O23_09050 [Duncaniella muris]|uniref:Uncharacterized protein n=1 Tax=Duncaniella muris TaxID=2094150 RepID=A0A2V1IJC3_9BACT|nr:hypothetical protein [Duncaniella muris]PWB01687.1 hypothetical protein C5O23_09050 [Duncaniella muris]GFI56808.1 hypothetical protein IMSAG025_00235 [Muribaculaceae bacterium]
MEKYYRMVIDLYKEALINQVNSERILEVKKEIANAITTARIQGNPYDGLQTLLEDVNMIVI